jgi:hypothetical protein
MFFCSYTSFFLKIVGGRNQEETEKIIIFSVPIEKLLLFIYDYLFVEKWI